MTCTAEAIRGGKSFVKSAISDTLQEDAQPYFQVNTDIYTLDDACITVFN